MDNGQIKNEMLQNSLFNNSQISDVDKSLLIPCLNDIIGTLEKMNIEITAENCIGRFSNLKISNDYEKDTTDFVTYDSIKNELKICFAKAETNNLGDFYYHYIYSLLSILSKSYDEEHQKNVDGIEFVDENGCVRGKIINELLKRNLAVNISKENPFDVSVSEFYYDSPSFYTMPDNLLEEVLYSKFGADEVVGCFISGRGDIIASKLSDLIGVEDTKELYSVIDEYSSNPIQSRQKYNRIITKLNLAYSESNSLNKM